MKRLFVQISVIIVAMGVLSGCYVSKIPAPARLPNVEEAYLSSEFWISRFPSAQRVLMERAEIQQINRMALNDETKLSDLFKEGTDDVHQVKQTYASIRQQFQRGTYYDHTALQISQDFFDRLFERMDLERMPEDSEPVFSLITRETDLRELPTEEVITKWPGDMAFDAIQYARLECGTVALVLHHTADRKWCLIKTSFATGWIRSLDLAVTSRPEAARFVGLPPLVITGAQAHVYLDPSFNLYGTSLPMGAVLPFVVRDGGFQVLIPTRDGEGRMKLRTGYLRDTEDVHIGYLPYTMENVIRQAFKLYGVRYGWGGTYGGRDCSRFIRDVFRTFGFNMPENSYRQSNIIFTQRIDVAGKRSREKMKILRNCEGKPALLYMKGHIVLYLGFVNDRPYAMHSTWGYRERGGWGQPRKRQVGRVVVSDLFLGEEGDIGSLLERLQVIAPLD